MPNNTCVHFVSRPELEEKVVSYFNSDINQQRIFVLHGLGGIGCVTTPWQSGNMINNRGQEDTAGPQSCTVAAVDVQCVLGTM